MQKKFQKYIDLLIEMTGSENNYDVIKEELNEVEKEIEVKKNDLKNIKKSMKDDKYLKENDRIIDENIKIGIENKKQVYQLELDKTLKLINKASIDEEDNHQALTSTVSRLKSLNALLTILQDKLKVIGKDKELSSFYENMIEKTTKEINELEKKRDILSKQYDKVRERLDYYGNNRIELEKKLQHLNIRLEDTLEALSTPNFYVDEILKKKDENIVDELNKELEELENHRLVLITDPVYIANQAMKMFTEEDYTSAITSIKELVTIIKSKPYMNETKKELNNLLNKAQTKLDEFANTIDNKTYLDEDSKVIENRINYLTTELETINNKITDIKNKIIDLDKNVVKNISKELNETENLYTNLKTTYEEYKTIVLSNDDTISPRKKANLQTAYNHKKEKMDLVYKLFENYQKELEEVIMQSKKLETIDLTELENRKENILDEIEELKKIKSNKAKIKDILAMEKDKETLNNLSKDVDDIKHSLKYDKKVDEIYQEIENLFDNDGEKEEQTTILDKNDYIDLNDFRIEKDQEEIKENEEFQTDEKILQVADENLEDTKVFPPRNSQEERLKVINVEEIPIKKNQTNEEPETLPENIESLDDEIPSLNDNINNTSEYISFNDILNGEDLNDNQK